MISHRKLKDSAIYTEFFHPLRIEQQLGMLMVDRKQGTIAVSMQREGLDFSQREKELLTLLQPHLIQAYKNASDITQARAEHLRSVCALHLAQVGVMHLTATRKIEWLSNHAAKWLTEYFPRDQERLANHVLPLRLESWLSQKAQLSAESLGAASCRDLKVETERGVLSFRCVAAASGDMDLVLSEQRHASLDQLESLGLGQREAEVLHWVAEGNSNHVIATILSVSKRTVDKQVENILRKLGVESRVAAALRAEQNRISGR